MSRYLFLLLILFLYSCERGKETKNFGETEYYFDEKLSSISPGNHGDFWIGSETGDLFNFRDNHRVSFNLIEDRIYKVLQEENTLGDTLFWIGVRNSGLQKWVKKGNSELQKLKTYTIEFKEDKYSPYDFVKIDNRIFVATSQGFFYLDTNTGTDQLKLIYSSDEYILHQENNTFLVHNICNYKDSLLLASTAKGVLAYDVNNGSYQFLFDNHHIEHISVYNDTVFTVTNEGLNLSGLDGQTIKSIPAENSPRVYYQIQGIHYLVGADEVMVSKDLDEFVSINLRRFVPMYCRNIILPDTINNFTYLLTENAVWRIPNNIDVFKSNKSVKASCYADGKTYYLTHENELYVQFPGNKKAKWIYTLPKDNIINWIDVVGNELYMCSVDYVFQKINISGNWLENALFHRPEVIYRSKTRVNSISIKNMGNELISFLGTQEGLISIDRNNKADTIPQLYGMYITSLFGHEYSGRIYISTLNDGVFYISQDNIIRKVPDTENRHFIRDITATNDHNSNLIMLTNQHIISQNPYDSIRVKGYQKLLYMNDSTFYGVPEFGIHKFTISNGKIQDRGRFFTDIRFNKNSTFSTHNRIFLGSSIGAVMLSAEDEETSLWTDFEQALNINLFYTLLILIIIIILSSIALVIVLRKHNVNKIHITKHKDDLHKRISDLLSYSNILEENEKVEVLEIRSLLSSMEINSANSKEIKSKLDTYSIRLAQINREIGLLIPQKLNSQMEEITSVDVFEKDLMIRESHEIRTHKDIQKINEQIKKNALWLEQRDNLISDLNNLLEQTAGWVEIEQVNKGVRDRLTDIRESMNSRPLSVLTEGFNRIVDEINSLNSTTTNNKIDDYILRIENYLSEKITKDDGLGFLTDTLNELKAKRILTDNIEYLKALKPVEQQFFVLMRLDEIKKLSDAYRNEHERINKENNALINKKFDKELSDLIAKHTKDISRQINARIEELYEHLLITDHHIIVDILKLTNIQGQHAKVLAILISDSKVKRSLIPGMLGVYGNLNPVISRLINDRIKANENYLRIYFSEPNHKTVFIQQILRLCD